MATEALEGREKRRNGYWPKRRDLAGRSVRGTVKSDLARERRYSFFQELSCSTFTT